MSDGTILVTGAAGQIGAAVVRRLASAGRPVAAIDRLGAKVGAVEVRPVDLTDVHALHALAARLRPAGIVHCGGISGPMLGRDNPMSIVSVNVDGTANMLEIARVHGAARFVYTSSISAYGPTGGAPIDAATPLRPSTVYGASKAMGEQLVGAYAAEHGLSGASLRLSWVYGPARTTPCLLRRMIAAGLAGEALDLPYGRGFPRQYIHVEDAAAALILALDAPAAIGSYAVTGGRTDDLDAIAAMVERAVPGAAIAVAPGPAPLDDHQGPIDIGPARRDLGYAPAIDLPDGIAAFAKALRA